MRGSAGGSARAIVQKAEANKRNIEYLKNPQVCKQCRKDIPLDGLAASLVRKKIFCNLRCSSLFNKNYTRGVKVEKEAKKLICRECKKEFEAQQSRGYCSRECRKLGYIKSIDIEQFRSNRRKQMKTEEDTANKLRKEGWQVLYTSNCCDRIGIKDGKVYFLEFKPPSDTSLRPSQKILSDVAREQFKIVLYADE